MQQSDSPWAHLSNGKKKIKELFSTTAIVLLLFDPSIPEGGLSSYKLKQLFCGSYISVPREWNLKIYQSSNSFQVLVFEKYIVPEL